MANRLLDAFWSFVKTRSGCLQLAIVAILVIHGLSIPFWIKGYWAPRSEVMRMMYQCLGSEEDEQARWKPNIVVVSACEGPKRTAISPAQTRIAVWARSHDEDWVVDAQTGHVLLAVPKSGLGFVDFVGEDLAVRMWRLGDTSQVISSIYDIRTGEVYQATRVAWRDPDLDDLSELHRESNGNAIQFIGARFSGLLFYTANGLKVRDFESSVPKVVQDLVDSWGIQKLKSPLFRAAETKMTAGGDTCLIGIEPDNGVSPITYYPSVCFASVAEPILLRP